MKTIKMAFEQGGNPMFFGEINNQGRDIKTKHLLTLVEFKVIDGRITWMMQSEKGEMYEGGANSYAIPGTDITVKPSVPLTMHQRLTGLAPEFIFEVPKNMKVYPLASVRKKYPDSGRRPRGLFGRGI